MTQVQGLIYEIFNPVRNHLETRLDRKEVACSDGMAETYNTDAKLASSSLYLQEFHSLQQRGGPWPGGPVYWAGTLQKTMWRKDRRNRGAGRCARRFSHVAVPWNNKNGMV